MDYTRPAAVEAVQRVTESLKARNIDVIVVKDREEALNKLKDLVPPGSEVFPGTSATLDTIGYSAFLKGTKEYTNLRDVVAAEPDPAKRALLRRRNTIADYFVGSV
ncbi:MAG: LUD domain-containing protein, partial [Chloroflexi bacterium]|nr:LUD domain-containing protein [Chloroflexota bacterium]